MGHARALINVEAVDAQLGIFKEIIEADLSVRNVEALVRSLSRDKSSKVSRNEKIEHGWERAMRDSSAKLAAQLGTPVKIRLSTKERGEIKITFTDVNDLNRILEMLAINR